MKTMSLHEFCNSNASVTFINALQQYQGRLTRFSCIGEPKRQNILVYLSNCAARIRTADGQEMEIQENGIYYAPLGAEYVMAVQHQAGGSTIGVNFHLTDEQGTPIVFSQDILGFRATTAMRRAFEQMAHSESLSTLQCRILLETVISDIAQQDCSPSVPPVIRPSVDYLLEHYTESPSIAQIAALSHISEVYFRRVFKSVFLMSPAAYISQLKLRKAAEYLEYGEMSVQEIAETVGYGGAAYFSKEFKAVYGTTPLRYRKEKRAGT